MTRSHTILLETEAYVNNYIIEQVSKAFSYHNIQHTIDVVLACRELAEFAGLPEKDAVILQLAAWFHDTGYDKGVAQHEVRSASLAEQFPFFFPLSRG